MTELCRKHGVSSPTFYKWKAKYGGLDVSEARRLRALEGENAKLKRMLADAMLDNLALKGLTRGPIGSLGARAPAGFILSRVTGNISGFVYKNIGRKITFS